MGRVAIVAPPGFGKTTSAIPFKSPELTIKGLDPKESVFMDVTGENLFPGYLANKSIKDGGNYIETNTYSKKIVQVLDYIGKNRQDVKNIIVDDLGHTMGFEKMANIKNKNFDVWTDLAVNHISIINKIRELNRTRKDLHIYCMYHSEIGKDGLLKIKTAGAMIDNTVALDGLFKIILYGEVKKDANGKVVYQFRTKGDGSSSCRSPLGMFDTDVIPNDLGIVKEAMDKFYGV